MTVSFAKSILVASCSVILFACEMGHGGSSGINESGTPVIRSFFASPASITRGQSATLSWDVVSATGLSLKTNNEAASETVSGTSTTVSPVSDSTYTLMAFGAGGTLATKTVSVAVKSPLGAPSITSFGADTTFLKKGDIVHLSWSVTQTTEVVLVDDTGATYPVQGASSLPLYPLATRTYTLTASNDAFSEKATQSLRVVVYDPDGSLTLNTFTATPASVQAGEPVTLTWDVINGTDFTIGGGGISLPLGRATSVVVNPLETTRYQLLSRNAINSQQSLAYVTVVVDGIIDPNGPVTINWFTALPSVVHPGEPVTLRWKTTNGTPYSIEGVDQSFELEKETSVVVYPKVSTLYRLLARNGNSSQSVAAQLTVKIDTGSPGPAILYFNANPAGTGTAEPVTLYWEVFDAESVSISPSVGKVAAHGSTVVYPSQTTTYVLTAQNDAGINVLSCSVVIQGVRNSRPPLAYWGRE